MTIEEVMHWVREYGREVSLKGVAESDYSSVRAAILALLDAEAEACHAIVSEEDLRWDAIDRIRARIAARKTKEPAFAGFTIGVDPGMEDGTVVLHHAGQVVRVVNLDTSTKENAK
jgi:predicted RNase H-like nuclease (RuvC/YqgF family)